MTEELSLSWEMHQDTLRKCVHIRVISSVHVSKISNPEPLMEDSLKMYSSDENHLVNHKDAKRDKPLTHSTSHLDLSGRRVDPLFCTVLLDAVSRNEITLIKFV